jgi:hypothetical protein
MTWRETRLVLVRLHISVHIDTQIDVFFLFRYLSEKLPPLSDGARFKRLSDQESSTVAMPDFTSDITAATR